MQEGLCRENGSKESPLEALAPAARDLLVEQETSPLQVLMVDVKGQSEEGTDRGKDTSGNWKKFREKIQNN